MSGRDLQVGGAIVVVVVLNENNKGLNLESECIDENKCHGLRQGSSSPRCSKSAANYHKV